MQTDSRFTQHSKLSGIMQSSTSTPENSGSSSNSSTSSSLSSFSTNDRVSMNVTYTFCSSCGVDTTIFSHEDHCPKARQHQ
ncbi:hypothetical protein BCR42DRAFT_424232 [Absidia repens]|uniref:Uncharacterized protein n=1 Tax=Absidia repens TaxID=90262 RepID=A0A1X2I400_9FUNG|nr:hypothetical protein BCR42DRAFT_424232 [Absidia repens]